MIRIVEDESCFLTLSFMKNKFRNKLTNHFNLIMHMFVQKFFIS
jgi:hypothetical protein